MAFVDTQVRPQGERVVSKLSALVRECGYGNSLDYHDCILGRAYTKLTGRSLLDDGIEFRLKGGGMGRGIRFSTFVEVAAKAFGVSCEAANKAELMCLRGCKAVTIANYLESQGL